MDNFLDVVSELGLNLNNGQCLEIVKEERSYIVEHIRQMKADKDTTFSAMERKIKLLCAYNVLIDRFEKYLGHED